MALRFGIDIGGTTTKLGVYRDYQFIDFLKQESDLDLLENLIQQAIDEFSVPEFIGFSFAGQVSDNKILSTQYVKGRALLDVDINHWTQELFQVPSRVDNDLNCAALAEKSYLQEEHIAVFYIGTGFGASFISEGNIVRGESNFAGEIGHIPFKKAPFTCPCGGKRCLELHVSGSALTRHKEFLGLQEKNLVELKTSENPLAVNIYRNFKKGFTHGLLTANALFNPTLFVLGGGVIKSNPWLVKIANDALFKKGFSPSRGEKAVMSELDEFAPAFGAIHLKELP